MRADQIIAAQILPEPYQGVSILLSERHSGMPAEGGNIYSRNKDQRVSWGQGKPSWQELQVGRTSCSNSTRADASGLPRLLPLLRGNTFNSSFFIVVIEARTIIAGVDTPSR